MTWLGGSLVGIGIGMLLVLILWRPRRLPPARAPDQSTWRPVTSRVTHIRVRGMDVPVVKAEEYCAAPDASPWYRLHAETKVTEDIELEHGEVFDLVMLDGVIVGPHQLTEGVPVKLKSGDTYHVSLNVEMLV